MKSERDLTGEIARIHKRFDGKATQYEVRVSRGSVEVRPHVDVEEDDLPHHDPRLSGEYALSDGTFIYVRADGPHLDWRLQQHFEKPCQDRQGLDSLYHQAGLSREHVRQGAIKAGRFGPPPDPWLDRLCRRLERPRVQNNVVVERADARGLRIVAINCEEGESRVHISHTLPPGDPAQFSEQVLKAARCFIMEHEAPWPACRLSRDELAGPHSTLIGGLQLGKYDIGGLTKSYPQWIIILSDTDSATRQALERCAKYRQMQDADEPYVKVAYPERMPHLYARLDHRYYPIECPIPQDNGGYCLQVDRACMDEIPKQSIYEGNQFEVIIQQGFFAEPEADVQ